MFGIGIGEIALIFIVALLVLGPDKLPQVANTVAKLFREFHKAKEEIKTSLVDIPTKIITVEPETQKPIVAEKIVLRKAEDAIAHGEPIETKDVTHG